MIIFTCTDLELEKWLAEIAQDQFDTVCEKHDAPQDEVLEELPERPGLLGTIPRMPQYQGGP